MSVPWRRDHFSGHAEGRTVGGQGIVVREIVDHFLQSHSAFGRQATLIEQTSHIGIAAGVDIDAEGRDRRLGDAVDGVVRQRSEEHTSELQSLMRTSYAVFCLKKK